MGQRNYLNMGLYTIPEAARLLHIPHARLRRWIQGDPHGAVHPLLTNEIQRIDRQIAISFLNLIEALFISKFIQYGLHVKSIRAMAEEAADFLGTPHPFATNILFKTDGKRIFAHVEKQSDDPRLYDLKKRNWALEPVLGPYLITAVDYGKAGYAKRWYPNKRTPHVILNPAASFGHPVLNDSGIPTRALYDAFMAEDRNAPIVAKWFDVPVQRVKEAVRFETALSRAA